MRTRTFVILALAAVAGACVTPVIPLPPPDPSRMGLTVDEERSEIVITGQPSQAHSDALFSFLNVRTGHGVVTVARGDGSFTTEPMKARDGDLLDLWVSRVVEDEPSGVVRVVVRYSGSLARATP